jgi:hypothetical protein
VIYSFWDMKNPKYVLLRRDKKLDGEVYRVVGKVTMLDRVIVFHCDVMVMRMGIYFVRWLSYCT